MSHCECGCGGLAPIAKKTNSKLGHVIGKPVRFIAGHNITHKGHVPWNAGTGKGWRDSRGYRAVRKDGKKIREHRALVEKHLGRKLEPTELVHHRNEIKTDNGLENLQIMSKAEHVREHHLGVKRSETTRAKMSAAWERRRAKNNEYIKAVKS